MLGVNPVFYCLINIILITVIYKAISKLDTDHNDKKAQEKFLHIMLQILYPFFLLLSLLISSGVFVITPVGDRELKLRYLLNFAGMRPVSYFIGIWLGDTVIFIVPSAILILCSWVLKMEGFTEVAGWIFLDLVIFSFPFIALNYLVGFMFTKAETAFKYQVLPMLIVWFFPEIAINFFSSSTQETATKIFGAISPVLSIQTCF